MASLIDVQFAGESRRIDGGGGALMTQGYESRGGGEVTFSVRLCVCVCLRQFEVICMHCAFFNVQQIVFEQRHAMLRSRL